MNAHRNGSRVPTWVKVSVPVVLFVVAVLAGLVVIATREPPECATAAAIEERFAPQLAHLKELLLAHGPDLKVDEDDSDETGDGEEESEIDEILSRRKMWWLDMDSDEDLFADPVILGASLRYRNTKHCVTEIGVKIFKEPDGSWTLSTRTPSVDEAAVTIFNAGPKRWLRYENRFEIGSEISRGCRLYLDLDLLETMSTQPSD